MGTAFWLLPSFTAARPEGAEPCVRPQLSADAALARAWPDGVSDVERQLAYDADVDACASVFLEGAPPDVTIRVVLPDGRETVRHVADEDALTATVKALVTRLPDLYRPPPAAKVVPESPPPERASARVRKLETGFAASLRLAAKPLFLGYGLSAHLYAVIDRWLAGVWMRWDFSELALAQRRVPSDHKMSTFLLGVMVGRRVEVGRCALDLTVGPNLMIENQEAFENTPMDTGGFFTDLSVGANLRLLFPRARTPRFMVLLGADAYPMRVGRTVHRHEPLPALPAYTTTLGLGVSWSAP